MGDRLWPVPISRLAADLLTNQDYPLGFHRDLFFRPGPADPFRMMRYGRTLETPIGVAAGPHTQLAQNIVASWLMGARYIELKTVQTLDELKISRPCIAAQDEGYNCEWSQELTLVESAEEYVKAWILIHSLRHQLGMADEPDPGFLFNLSVGYNLDGIRQPNVQQFLASIGDCTALADRLIAEMEPVYPEIRTVRVPSRVSDNVTLSTMHGCPPDEIEQIARYLIQELGLNTTVKLNPTLLGQKDVRGILNQTLGYQTEVPDLAFEHDLDYPQAIGLIDSLTECADAAKVGFSIKLTNTLETTNTGTSLPAGEEMVYMSGRPLHVVSVQLAARLQRRYSGELDITFSAGADCYNTPDLLACGLEPVTVCTDLLKPGGYSRLIQYLEQIRDRMDLVGAESLADWQRLSPGGTSVLENLESYAAGLLSDPAYRKDSRVFGQDIRTARPLDPFDCVRAPCVETCPADQAVPDYMYLTALGRYGEAMEVIERANPLPRVTGLVCDHLCQFKCTRVAYDQPVRIRDIKRFVTERGARSFSLPPAGAFSVDAPSRAERQVHSDRPRFAVVGGGPSGLSCAVFLARQGVGVEIWEGRPYLGGMLRDAIPRFRLTVDDIGEDLAALEALGVTVHLSSPVDRPLFRDLCERFDGVYVAPGAQKDRELGIPGEREAGLEGALSFLGRINRQEEVTVGPKVAVIGGGNSAVDAARVSFRLAGPTGEVSLLYRRTVEQMPADHEELTAIGEEGVAICELITPVGARRSGSGIVLTLRRMELGEPDDSGRPRPIELPGSDYTLVFDTVLTAIGQETDLSFADDGILQPAEAAEAGTPSLGGDALRGPASVILGVGDGRAAARGLLRSVGLTDRGSEPIAVRKSLSLADQQQHAARRAPAAELGSLTVDQRPTFQRVIPTLTEEQARAEAARCLQCDQICNLCVSVCPNRANWFYTAVRFRGPVQRVSQTTERLLIEDLVPLEVTQGVQTLNIADWCNECGNCGLFCPTAGDPSRDKPRFALSEESYRVEDRVYRLGAGGVLTFRSDCVERWVKPDGDQCRYSAPGVDLDLGSDYQVTRAVLKDGVTQVDTREALQMIFLARSLAETALGRLLSGETNSG